MSAGIVLTGAELDALEGLPYAAQVLYVLGIRPRMDYRTRRVGDSPRVSWQALAESLYIEPYPGPQRTGGVSKWQAMRIAKHLERAGLIEIRSSEVHRILAFRLPLARGDSLAQNKPATDPQHPSATPRGSESRRHAIGESDVIAFGSMVKPATPQTPKPATHPLSVVPSSNYQTTTTSTLRSDAAGVVASRPGGPGELIFPAQLTDAEKGAIREMLERARANGTSQALLDELAGAIATGRVKNRTAYARALIASYRKGTFIPEKAHQIAERRANERRYTELLKKPPT